MSDLIDQIIKTNRSPELSPWFKNQLENQIQLGIYHGSQELMLESLVASLQKYSYNQNINTVVVGMSGGIDSAVTGMIFQKAGFTVIPAILPIHQNPQETKLGHQACEAMGIEPVCIDLSDQYDAMVDVLSVTDTDLKSGLSLASKIRKGNIRARLRMTTLYNLAHLHDGVVASTDNFSEMAAGFWTLHGDVGDVAPIQSLTKSWEIPALAEYLGVPEPIRKAIPTDGLGISSSDEEQLGFSYLEFDIGVFTMMYLNELPDNVISDACQADLVLLDHIRNRARTTGFKRKNPVNLNHPFHKTRFVRLNRLDNSSWDPYN